MQEVSYSFSLKFSVQDTIASPVLRDSSNSTYTIFPLLEVNARLTKMNLNTKIGVGIRSSLSTMAPTVYPCL